MPRGRPAKQFGRRQTLFILAGLALLALLLVLDTGRASRSRTEVPSLAGQRGGLSESSDGQAAPDFSITLFDGATFRLAEQRGQAIVLNFWASWCVPCRVEMPYFETTYRAYKDRGVTFVGVTVQDDPADSQAFLKELGITYPSGPDEGNAIALLYQLRGLPTTAFIRRDGTLARTWIGPIDEKDLVTLVEEIAR